LPALAVPYWLFRVSNVVDAEIKAELYDEVEGKRVVLIFIGREIIGSSQRVVALARQGKAR